VITITLLKLVPRTCTQFCYHC